MVEHLVELAAVVFAGMIVLVPVTAVAFRFAIKPVLSTWREVRNGPAGRQQLLVEQRILLLEEELQQVQDGLEAVSEAHSFDTRLGAAAKLHRDDVQVPGSGAHGP